MASVTYLLYWTDKFPKRLVVGWNGVGRWGGSISVCVLGWGCVCVGGGGGGGGHKEAVAVNMPQCLYDIYWDSIKPIPAYFQHIIAYLQGWHWANSSLVLSHLLCRTFFELVTGPAEQLWILFPIILMIAWISNLIISCCCQLSFVQWLLHEWHKIKL